MNALMIDIETLSLKPTAMVHQVGYMIANLATGEVYVPPTNVWVHPDQVGTVIDFDTVRWWMAQDAAVAKKVFSMPDENRLSPKHLFSLFQSEVLAFDPDVYASPAMFDLPVLTNLWGGNKPWEYNRERDMMTLYKWLDPQGLLEPPPIENAHDAASDAKWQMDYLMALYKKVLSIQSQNTADLKLIVG